MMATPGEGPLMDAHRDDRPGAAPLSFLGRRVPPAFRARVVTIGPGGALAYEAAAWADALVIVERGALELACADGGSVHLTGGDVLWLAGLPVLALRNPGHEPVVLTAVSRHPRPGA
jgi:quercetin dioxygenase-like cupin family protein